MEVGWKCWENEGQQMNNKMYNVGTNENEADQGGDGQIISSSTKATGLT